MYYRYKNNNNKDDISYSFSLESYIDSLNNDYNFNDYKIKVNNKTYDELSIEHNRLHNEINKLMNEDFNKYSEEDLKDNLSKFWNFLKNLWNKLIERIQTFINKIVAKIYEFTVRSKDGLYKKFKSKVFTTLDIKINDRKLNPNIILNMNNYTDKVENWSNSIKNLAMDQSQSSLNIFSETINDLNNIQEENINTFIDNIFYSENKKSETTIREYFGCNVGETPKAIIILSDEYTKKLKKIKDKMETFLKILKIQKRRIFSLSQITETEINKLKNIIENVNFFHNINYNFFIKAIQIRGKIAKYILKGILGDLVENKKEIKDIRTITFRDIYNNNFTENLFDNQLSIKYKSNRVLFDYKSNKEKIFKNDNEFTNIFLDFIEKIKPYGSFPYFFEPDNNKNNHFLFEYFKPIIKFFELKIPDNTKNCIVRKIFKGQDSISFEIMYGTEQFVTKSSDILFHSSEKKFDLIKGFSNSLDAVIYSSNRLYVGINQIYSRFGGFVEKGDNLYVYKIPLSLNPNLIVYKDYEIGGNAGYIEFNNINQIENFERIDEYL